MCVTTNPRAPKDSENAMAAIEHKVPLTCKLNKLLLEVEIQSKLVNFS